MFDDQPDRPAERESLVRGGTQWSLLELFFVMTLVACAITLRQFIGPLLALGLGGTAAVVAAVRWIDCENPILSGLVGFAASLAASFIVIGMATLEAPTAAALVIIASGAGYSAGVLWSELSNAA